MIRLLGGGIGLLGVLAGCAMGSPVLQTSPASSHAAARVFAAAGQPVGAIAPATRAAMAAVLGAR
jgi:hypothetical protein